MKSRSKLLRVFALATAGLIGAIASPSSSTATTLEARQSRLADGPRFDVSFAKSARAEAITGRVYVALSRLRDSSGSPIERAGETGDPLFAVNVEELAPGKAATID